MSPFWDQQTDACLKGPWHAQKGRVVVADLDNDSVIDYFRKLNTGDKLPKKTVNEVQERGIYKPGVRVPVTTVAWIQAQNNRMFNSGDTGDNTN